MKKEMLSVRSLSAGIEGKEIINDISLNINYGEVHVVMGPNGSGKSTLANVLMNNPVYEVTGGDILFDGESILELTTDKRARLGMFMSFQNPLEVAGVSVENFIRTAKQLRSEKRLSAIQFRKDLYQMMDHLIIDHQYASRYLNTGFSGGEKKKNEILQMMMLQPKLAILDETDSGLDVDATKIVSESLEKFKSPNNALLIITHHHTLISNLVPDYVHVLVDGRLIRSGGPELIHRIENEGFAFVKEEVQ